MSQPVTHVYQVYIKTSPDKLWESITNPDLTENYFMNARFESDWKPGSSLVLRDPADNEIMLDNKVISVDKPNKLVHTFKPGSGDDESKVTWEIKPMGDVCLLEVTHEFADAQSPEIQGTQRGWPKVLSGLKTFVETGKRLDIPSPEPVAST